MCFCLCVFLLPITCRYPYVRYERRSGTNPQSAIFTECLNFYIYSAILGYISIYLHRHRYGTFIRSRSLKNELYYTLRYWMRVPKITSSYMILDNQMIWWNNKHTLNMVTPFIFGSYIIIIWWEDDGRCRRCCSSQQLWRGQALLFTLLFSTRCCCCCSTGEIALHIRLAHIVPSAFILWFIMHTMAVQMQQQSIAARRPFTRYYHRQCFFSHAFVAVVLLLNGIRRWHLEIETHLLFAYKYIQ